MDMQIAEFVALNKNTSDLIYNHLSEKIIYRKLKNKDGIECVWEIKKTVKGYVERELPPEEMPMEAFDFWKQWLTETAQQYSKQDARETRHNVSIENMLEIYTAVEQKDEAEALEFYDKRVRIGMWLLQRCLTSTQRRRYILYHYYGKTEKEIAKMAGVTQRAVSYSLIAAQKRLDAKWKMLKKSKQTF